MTIKFNPYKEAANDVQMQRDATRRYHRGWCRKCNSEQPLKGGRVVVPSGRFGVHNGTVRNFTCAKCIAKGSEQHATPESAA